MYTDEEITKAGTDAGFSNHEIEVLIYQLIDNKKLERQPNGSKPIVSGSPCNHNFIPLGEGVMGCKCGKWIWRGDR